MAKRCHKSSRNKSEEILSDRVQFENNYQENLVEDGRAASSVNLGSDIDDDDDTEAGVVLEDLDEDDMTLKDESTKTVKKKCRKLKKFINIKDLDILKFISNRSKYSQELSNKLEKLNAEVELVPEKSLIIVTKKPISRYVKDWKKRCYSIVTKFCSRFRKNCFELKDSSSVQKAWTRLGKMLQWSNAMYWIESNKILAVMTEQNECEQVLKNVREFLGNDDAEIKVEYSRPTEKQNQENILLKAVNNPEFIPRSFQEPERNFAPTSASATTGPQLVQAEWNGYATDSSGRAKAELNEDFYRRMHLEQYGPYVPYVEEQKRPKEVVKSVKISSDHVDYIERIQFLNTLKQCHPGMVEAFMTKAKNKICLKGSNEAILVAKQQYEDLVKELNVIELPTEVKHFVSQKEGLEFINNRLSNNESVYVIVVGAAKVKVVAQSPQVCEEVRECLCKNVRKATINLPPESEHIFASKQWYEITKTIETERLVDYQINFVQQTRDGIELRGATQLVKKFEKRIKDFINAQKIDCDRMDLPSGKARFMKEKLTEEIAKIESDLKEEQVKINILLERGTCECKGTKEGIRESKRRVLALRNEITPKSKDYSRIGICTLFFSENGRRNIKEIEAGRNVIIEISKEPNVVKKESTQAEVETIRAEQAQEKSKIHKAPSTDPFDQCNFTTREGLTVSWKYGNIAQERADILVSSAVRNLSNPAMVGRVMNSVGGSSFVAACCQHTNIGTGDIATTIGGNLLCQYVIHAVCCDWSSNGVAEQTLRRLLLKILLECTRRSASSVAMPLIGTGKRGFPEDLVLRVMREEFEKFSSMYSSRTLKEIKLIRYDPSGRRMAVQAPPVSGLSYRIPTVTNESTNTFVPLVAGSSAETVKLQVFARSSTDIFSAFDEIETFIEDHLTSETLNHEKNYDVVLKHWDELKVLTKDRDLKITCLDPTTVLMEGVLSKVVEAKDKLTELVKKLIGSAASQGSEFSLPSNWTPQPENQLVQMVSIASSSQEYMEVKNHFVARGGNARQLYKVERIQNPQLYSRYLAFKKSMRGQVNEMRLFHGTDAANVDSINAHNFSRSFAGVNGVSYGHGVYFARDASYSMGYANRQRSGSHPKMYMAKVLVGEYTRGAKRMKAPPLKNDPNNPGLRYDSVVDHPSNPSRYIIFQDNQYYPEYLLTMR